ITAGRQPFRLGSGLLLDDDGVGLTGFVAERPLWWDTKLVAFVFQPRAVGNQALNMYGAMIEVPGADGVWQFHHLYEDDLDSPVGLGAKANEAQRHFTAARYVMKKGKMTFDGEFAIQRGGSVGRTVSGAAQDVNFQGYGYSMQARWDQSMGKYGQGE